jgi:hypothetical protein
MDDNMDYTTTAAEGDAFCAHPAGRQLSVDQRF